MLSCEVKTFTLVSEFGHVCLEYLIQQWSNSSMLDVLTIEDWTTTLLSQNVRFQSLTDSGTIFLKDGDLIIMYACTYVRIYVYVSNSDIIKIFFFVRPLCHCFSSELILLTQKIVVATERKFY